MLSKLRMFVTVAVLAGLISTASAQNQGKADTKRPPTNSTQKSGDQAKKPTKTAPKGEPLSEDRMSTRKLSPPKESPPGKTKKVKAAHRPAKPAPKEPN